MGYTTDFYGGVSVTPPLNEAERAYLRKFAETRRMDRERGPYFVDGTGDFGQGSDADIRNFNSPPEGQPGLWCQWVPTDDGAAIEWDEGEKFYESDAWMAYIIDHFLKSGAEAQKQILRAERLNARVPELDQFAGFTFDHVVNGVIEAQGEDPDDKWRLVVEDNNVRAQHAKIVWED
jgi:hypothetical protein